MTYLTQTVAGFNTAFWCSVLHENLLSSIQRRSLVCFTPAHDDTKWAEVQIHRFSLARAHLVECAGCSSNEEIWSKGVRDAVITEGFPETDGTLHKIYGRDHDLICASIECVKVVFAKSCTVVKAYCSSVSRWALLQRYCSSPLTDPRHERLV